MAKLKTVTLVAPDGGEVAVSHPASVNSLVFGSGYKVKGGGSVDKALASLAEQVEDDGVLVAPQATVTETKPSK